MGLDEILNVVFGDKKIDEEKGEIKGVGVSGLLYFFQRQEVVKPPTVDTVYRASEIARVCPREEVICAIKKITRTRIIDAESFYAMEMGTAVHRVIRDMLTPFGVLYGRWECLNCGDNVIDSVGTGFCKKCHRYAMVYREEIVQKGYLSGHTDGILVLGGEKYLLEIKSNESVVEMKSPKSEHRVQWTVYQYLTGLKKGIMLYVKRSALFPVEFEVDYDEVILKGVLSKIEKIKEGIISGKLPDGVCKEGVLKKSCPVREICELGL